MFPAEFRQERRENQPMKDEDYMRLALQKAEEGLRNGEVPIGAVLVREGIVIAAAHNWREHGHDPTAHAEILVLRRGARRLSRWRLTGCTLYVTIEPCVMCAGAIMNARVSRLVYGAPDVQAGAIRSRRCIDEAAGFGGSLAVRTGVCEEECRALLQEFFLTHRYRGDVSKWS